MTVDAALVGVGVLVGVVVVVQLGRYLAGGRGVRVGAQVVRVWAPGRRAPRRDGVPAEVAFTDPGTGREYVLGVRGGLGGKLDAAWVGREVDVRFPAGKPEKFRVLSGPGGPNRELISIGVGGFVVAIVMVGRFTSGNGRFGWVMAGFGVLWVLISAATIVVAIREIAHRRALMGAPIAVPGRVVTLIESNHNGEDGESSHSYTPVVAFTTHEGREVLGISQVGNAGRRTWTGREVPVLYAPADPAVFRLDYATDRFSAGCGVFLLLFFLLFGIALTAGGVVVAGL